MPNGASGSVVPSSFDHDFLHRSTIATIWEGQSQTHAHTHVRIVCTFSTAVQHTTRSSSSLTRWHKHLLRFQEQAAASI